MTSLKLNGDMKAHISSFKNIIRQLENAGEKKSDGATVAVFMRTLPRSYDEINTILSLSDVTLKKVFSAVLDKYTRYETRQEVPVRTTLLHKQAKRLNMGVRPSCKNCRRMGHKEESCWGKAGGEGTATKCNDCGKLGHTRKTCWRPQKKKLDEQTTLGDHPHGAAEGRYPEWKPSDCKW